MPFWQDFVEALGPPVYRVCGQEPRLGFGAHGNPPRAVNLSFGDWGALVVVETSVEPIGDSRILMEMMMNAEPEYPLTVSETTISVVVDRNTTSFRMLCMEDDRWSAVAPVADRWVSLRGLGVRPERIAIESLHTG